MTAVVAEATTRPYGLAFARPIVTSRGRFTHRRGWLLRVADAEGRVGWGDAAPWPGFGSSDEAVTEALGELSDGRLEGMDIDGVEAVASDVARLGLPSEAACALEVALLDIIAQRDERPLTALLGEERTTAASTHTLVTGEPDPASRWLKLKTGTERLEALEARLARVVAAAHPEARIRLDVGGAWTEEQTDRALSRLSRYRVHTLEQPLATGDLPALARLRAAATELDIAIAADEEVTDIRALEQLLRAGAVDEVVLKPMYVGGLLAARRMARLATENGCRATITNALESAVGRGAARHLAAALPGVHGLSDPLADDVASLPRRVGNRVALPPGHGLGVRPNGRSRAANRPTISIPNPVRSSALARPQHPALVIADRSWTQRELAEASAVRAHALLARGIVPGARVALAGPPAADWVAWLHAVGWIGAAAVPLPHRGPERERARILRAAQPAIVVDTAAPVRANALAAERDWPLDETRVVICSSGTTGEPKPHALTTAQLLTSAFGSAIRLGHRADDRWLACLPLHHVGGLSILVRCAFYATTVVLHERFDAERVASALDEGEATLVSLVPQMLTRVLDARRERPFPSSLRAILLGGGPAPTALLDRCDRIGAPVALTWGMTEAASQVATSFPESRRLVPLPFARVEARHGRLVVRGPIATGPELATSDAGTVTEDGFIEIDGRADDVLISGGEKVAPAEIEAVLRHHPGVEDAAIVARRSARWGARPYAVLETTGDLDPSAVAAWCRERLARFKVPEGFVCVPALPRTTLGKVARARVRDLVDAAFPAETPEAHRRKAQP